MSNKITMRNTRSNFSSYCKKCFGLCCVALPYAKSVDFPYNKKGGVPCPNLQDDYGCAIHQDLRGSGFKGCTVYECFGAGQKVSQHTYGGKDWRDNLEIAKEMFAVFPIMQQLHEILSYLYEALSLAEAEILAKDLLRVIEETERLTNLEPKSILDLDIPGHRAIASDLLVQASQLMRNKVQEKIRVGKQTKLNRGRDHVAAKLKGADLRGASLRGVLFIAADLREADLRWSDLIGTDLRDADLRGANLLDSIFLTQAQVNAAKGDSNTRLPLGLSRPQHWSS